MIGHLRFVRAPPHHSFSFSPLTLSDISRATSEESYTATAEFYAVDARVSASLVSSSSLALRSVRHEPPFRPRSHAMGYATICRHAPPL